MKRNSSILILLVVVLLASCASFNTSKSVKKDKVYSEDLTSYLPKDQAPIDSSAITVGNSENKNTVDPALEISYRLDTALAFVNNYTDETTRFIEGLVIQIYAGINRSEAKEVQLKALRYFPDSKPHLIFDQPNYKVQMEKFYTHLEAYPVFRSVQARFPKAILIPTRIPVERDSN